jgi:prevent-host-death family protein
MSTAKRIPIGLFKATCLRVLDDVRTTGEPVVVTKRGVPVAQVIPPPAAESRLAKAGSLRWVTNILGDLVEPAASLDEWEALRS